jgi:3-dehydroquinate synthase II
MLKRLGLFQRTTTDLKVGDEVLAYARSSSGRHFGMPVDEFILEK